MSSSSELEAIAATYDDPQYQQQAEMAALAADGAQRALP